MRKLFTLLFALLSVFAVTSCDSDDPQTAAPDKPESGLVRVKVCIGVQQPTLTGTTRAADLPDSLAVNGEMMGSWMVAAVKNGTVEEIISSADLSPRLEQDSAWTYLTADAEGETHTFYSFANLTDDEIAGLGIVKGQPLPDDFDTRTFSVNGNQSSVDGFPNGIPMSNKQEARVQAGGEVNLEVVRMVAKVRVVVTNTGTKDINVAGIAIRDITANGSNNITLMPGGLTGSVRDEALPSTAVKDTAVYSLAGDDMTVAGGKSLIWSFYVNPSHATTAAGHFVVSLRTGKNSASPYYNYDRPFVFTDGITADGLWSTVARNELHVLKIDLADYDIRFSAVGFTAIGVLPSYSTVPSMSVINLGMYGQYHIIPLVRDWETGRTVPYRNQYSDNSRTLVDNDVAITQARDSGYTASAMPRFFWNNTGSTSYMEYEVGNYTGYVIYELTAVVRDPDNTTHTITRRFKVAMTAIDFSTLAKRRRR